MKEIYDALLNRGQSISEKELISFIIDGLGPEFDPVVVHLMSKLDSVSKEINLAETKFFSF